MSSQVVNFTFLNWLYQILIIFWSIRGLNFIYLTILFCHTLIVRLLIYAHLTICNTMRVLHIHLLILVLKINLALNLLMVFLVEIKLTGLHILSRLFLIWHIRCWILFNRAFKLILLWVAHLTRRICLLRILLTTILVAHLTMIFILKFN